MEGIHKRDYRECAIIVRTASTEHSIVHEREAFVVTTTKGPGRGNVYRGESLGISPYGSRLVAGAEPILVISDHKMGLMTEVKSFMIETEDSIYLIEYKPDKKLFKVEKIKGNKGEMGVGNRLYPTFLDLCYGRLTLEDERMNKMHVTSPIKNIFAFYGRENLP
ncbi:MAG: hypothetical protein PHX30_04815 [Candidatus Pacebacteria bacterium]|nr:hypothetical protein [Candidatus Paceibacterota bacterium]